MRIKRDNKLAIYGGTPLRSQAMPVRKAFGQAEKQALLSLFDYYDAIDQDPGYQDHFEAEYCRLFCDYHGGGYCDVVASGTLALYVALFALDLPKGSEVLVSPITDPGTLNAIILLGLKPRLIDTAPLSYNATSEQIKARFDKNVSCLIIVHAAGFASDIEEIVKLCRQHDVKVLEDCSQAHGASYRGCKVGTFGDIAAFSTMSRKSSTTGPTGGVVYTKNLDLHRRALAFADRGKPIWRDDFDGRKPSNYLFPALNLNSNELCCAVGLASFQRLDDTRQKRIGFLSELGKVLVASSKVCLPSPVSEEDSPFFHPIFVKTELLSCSKIEFAQAVLAEGVPLNPHYSFLVQDWLWAKDYLADDFYCTNAVATVNASFCLYLNEHYGAQEVSDTAAAISKVERFFLHQ